MTDLTRTEMDELLLEHEIAELEYDIPRTMATLVPNPHYEMAFLGLAVDGWDAVQHTYTRLINEAARDRNVQAVARVIAEAANTLIREAHVSFDRADGSRATGSYIVVLEFDPATKKIVGERMYGDTIYAEFMAEVIGAGLENQPGVTKLADSAPMIDRHDAFDAAAARGLRIHNNRVKG
jgi:hypothetical protein